MKRKNFKKPMISALEQRILFDGAAVATAVDVLDESSFSSNNNTQTTTNSNDVTQNNAENSVHEAQAVQGFERPRREVAFVDVTVSDYQTLVDGVGEGVEVYLVSSLDDINSILKSETNIDAIHILSHGNVGEITVGNDVLNQNTLNSFDAVLQTMKNSLSENGDILLYGCNVASDGTGQEFIDTLASITEADVAASNDVTGNSSVNGNWDLEIQKGSIETSTIVVENYNYSLAPSISGLTNISFTEHDPKITAANSISFSGGANYGNGYIEFKVSSNMDVGDRLSIDSGGSVTVTGNNVYYSGTLVGTIDSTYNGESGKALRINLLNQTIAGTSPVKNGDFSAGMTGWTSVLSHIDLGVTQIAGWNTPSDSLITYPSSTPGNDDNDLVSGFYNPYVGVDSGRLKLEETNLTTTGFGVAHGPAAYSDIFNATTGMVLKFDWQANNVNDDYHVVGYLLNTSNGAISIALQSYGTTGSGTASVTVPTSGNYRFVFVSGTFDATGGTVAGASMYIDNIRVEDPFVTDAVVTEIARQIDYINSTDDLNINKIVTVTAKNSLNETTSSNFNINVTTSNDLPYISGKETVTVNEDTSITISGLTVGDKDIGSGNLTVTIDASHGTLSLGNSTGVTTSWNAENKIFQITGTVTNLNNALATLRYQGDANWFGDDPLTITINDGQGSGEQPYRINQTGKFFNPDNGHYYEFVSASGITWDLAKTNSESRTLYGLNGYLVTITSNSENTLITSMAGGNGWIGASDAQSEGIWKWVTGPEKGTQFWTGDTNAGTNSTSNYGSSYNGQYSNWADGEPNNSDSSRGGEDVAHFYSGINAGKWNDFAAINNSAIAGYIVEYGGYGGTLAAANLTVKVLSVNDLPVNKIPTARTTNEDVNIVFSTANVNAISISDNDALNDPSVILTTTLSIESGKGTLTLSEGSGATITNNGSTTVQIKGTVAQINASLEGLTYTPTLNANGTAYTTLTITTNDGVSTDTDSITINITPVDDKPVANSMAATVGVGSAQLFSYFKPNFFDVEGDSPVAIKLLSSPVKGQFEYWNGTSWEIVTINETTPLVVAMSDMNNYRFNALSESNTSTTVQWQVKTAGDTSDTGWSNTATGTISILSYADNTTPSVSITYPERTETGTSSKKVIESPDSTNPTSSVKTVTSNNVITIDEDSQTATITLTYSDSVTPAQFMQGILSSSNTRLIDFADSSTFKMTQSVTNNVGTITLILKPKANMYGETLITLGAFDGQKTTQETFILRVNSVNEQAIVDNFTRTINEDTSFSFATINPADIYHDANDVNNNANVSAVDYNAQMAIIQDAMINPNTDKQAAKITAIETLVKANYFPQSFIIDTLPTNGDLYLDGIKIESTNYTVAIANLEKLVYQPDLNYFGTDSFTWHALDKEGLATTIKTATFTIDAVNDAPVFTNQSENTVEGNTITGVLPASDVDSTSISFSVNGTAPTGFILNNDGSYSFDTSSYNYIGEGETDTIIIPINVRDAEGLVTTANFSVTITGTNDAPTIQIVDVSGIITDGIKLSDNGSITFVDLDLTDRPVATEVTKSVNAVGQDGKTTLVLTEQQRSDIENAFNIVNVNTNTNNGTITWDYTISQDKINFLGKGEVVTAVFTISVIDDERAIATQDVTVTITGTNDAPTIQIVDVSGIITDGIKLSDNGSITFVDLDLTDRPVATEVTKSVNAVGQDGKTTLVLTEQQRSDIENAFNIVNVNTNTNNGTITWDYTISQDKINFLGKGEVVTAVFTISVIDDERAIATQDVTVTITGTNDAPTIQIVDVSGIITDGIKLSDNGSITFVDLDLTDRPVATEVTKSVNAVGQDGKTTLVLTEQQRSDIENAFNIVNVNTNTNNGTITWDYTISQDKINFLGKGEVVTAVFTISVIDDERAIATQDVTVTITGTNDAPTIQIVDVSGIITDGIKLSDNGSITFVDLDLTDRPVATEVTKSVNAVGQDGKTTLVLTEQQRSDIENAFNIVNVNTNTNNGTITWDYTISQDKINFLGKGEVVTAVFTISVIDDERAIATQDVTVTITGTNDAPTIQIVDVSGIITDGIKLSDNGSITFVDLDLTDRPVATEVTKSVNAVGQDGKTTLVLTEQQRSDIENAFNIVNVNTNTNNGTITWDYTISQDKINFLGKGEVVTAVFTISVIDDERAIATQDVTVTITGTNDAPTIQIVDVSGIITDGIKLSDNGSITFVDLDLTDRPVATEVTKSVNAVGQDGKTTLVLTEQQRSDIENAFNIVNVNTNTNNGTITWDYTISQDKINFLGKGEVVTAVFTISVIDDERAIATQDVTVTITGTNDAPTIQIVDVSGIITDGIKLSDNGSITFVDLDLTDRPVATEVTKSVNAVGQDGKTTLVLTEQQRSDIENAFNIVNVNTNTNNGTITWDYTISQDKINFLGKGEVVTAVFTISVIDDERAIATQDVTVTITGTNDAPTIQIVDVSGIITDGIKLSDNGSITFVDLDLTDRPVATEVTKSVNAVGQDGKTTLVLTEQQRSDIENAFNIVNVNTNTNNGTITWDYTISQDKINFLGKGEVVTAVFTISVIDDERAIATQDVTVTITGTNDAPTIQIVDVSGIITDGIKLSDNGSITFVDLDLTDRPVATEVTKSVNAVGQDGKTTLVLTEQQRSDIENAFNIVNVNTNTNNGTITWDYTISQDKINFLGKGEVVTAVFTISVIDDERAIATQDVTVTITGSNDTPTVSFENIDFEIPFGEVYNKDISSLFSDKDLTDNFRFEATNLPLGLTIDSNTGIISGRVAQSGNFVIVIKGIDSAGASVTRTYNMLVIAPAQIAEPTNPAAPTVPTNGDTNTNNSTDGLNNFTDSASNLGVLNFNSNDGLSFDTGIGFLDTSNNSSTNGGELNSSNIQNGEIDSSNNNSTNTSNTNDSRGVLQANVDLNVLTNGQIVFNEANQDSFSIVGITIEDIKIENNSIEIKVVDTNLSQNFIVTQIDGSPLPTGLFFDAKTGSVSGTVPEGLDKLNITIKATNSDGTTRVLNLKLDLKELKKSQANQADADEKYMGLKEQIALENQKLDDYGSYLTRLFA